VYIYRRLCTCFVSGGGLLSVSSCTDQEERERKKRDWLWGGDQK